MDIVLLNPIIYSEVWIYTVLSFFKSHYSSALIKSTHTAVKSTLVAETSNSESWFFILDKIENHLVFWMKTDDGPNKI